MTGDEWARLAEAVVAAVVNAIDPQHDPDCTCDLGDDFGCWFRNSHLEMQRERIERAEFEVELYLRKLAQLVTTKQMTALAAVS